MERGDKQSIIYAHIVENDARKFSESFKKGTLNQDLQDYKNKTFNPWYIKEAIGDFFKKKDKSE